MRINARKAHVKDSFPVGIHNSPYLGLAHLFAAKLCFAVRRNMIPAAMPPFFVSRKSGGGAAG
ncbi:MAG TPA: hypothetical protein PKA82_08645 [Pyrinomonadaceae bacterium]|nr:hypothetical protein [Pyrinomonadaceae bacterium]